MQFVRDGVLRQLYIHVQPSSFDSPHLLLLLLLLLPLLLLQSCLAESGIELPSPIQEAAMPQLLAGHNAAVQSYTGSGKVSSSCARTSYK
jgi:superfamily II DNA/RNA helicase